MLFLLFLASFTTVLLIGVQQLNVEHRKYLRAIVTSIGISVANYLLYKILSSGDLQFYQFLVFSVGGALGIISAMWVHDHFLSS